VEAGGQHIHGFRRGLDYAFILGPAGLQDAERVMPQGRPLGILVPAQEAGSLHSGSMSLYRAGLELASFLPLGVTMPLIGQRRQASPM